MTRVLRLLLVEDNAADARLLEALLEDARGPALGFSLQTAPTLTAGIECLRQADFDVVLLDLNLPECSGLETIRRLVGCGARLPALVVLSGMRDEDVAVQALQSGAQDYLIKGQVDGPQLARAIRYALGRRQAEASAAREQERARELADERVRRRQVQSESEGLRRLLDEREQMLAERNELLEVLAHEVRQPLNTASAALQSVLAAIGRADDRTPGDVHRALAHAQQVLDHVMGTLNNTLAAATLLAAGERGTQTDTDLDTLIGMVVRDIGLDQRSRVVVEMRSELRTAQMQPMMMRLALCNLLLNALAYSPEGSPVRLCVSDLDALPGLCFEVLDEGPGIDEALRPVVFEKGTRGAGTRAGTGAGLGLYIVRRVAELHRGSLELLPRRPHGTTARICIPQGIED